MGSFSYRILIIGILIYLSYCALKVEEEILRLDLAIISPKICYNQSMKFNKILVYNIDKSKNLDTESSNKIESLGNKTVFVPKDDPKLKRELADTDCILVNFGTIVGREEIDRVLPN